MDHNTKSVNKLLCIENLIEIELKKSNNSNIVRMIIGSFSSDLTNDELNHLNSKYLNPIKYAEHNQEIKDNFYEGQNKRRRIN